MDAQELYGQMLDIAIAVMRSDFASIQIIETDAENGGVLHLLAWKGFHPQSARFWESVTLDSNSACAEAMRRRERFTIADTEQCELITGTPDLKEFQRSGIRSVQSTPLISHSGQLQGMISTHWRQPHESDEKALFLLDKLSRQVADLIESRKLEEALREREEHLKLAMQGAATGAWEIDLSTGENVWSKGMPELLGLPEHTKIDTQRWAEYVHPDDRDNVIASFREASMNDKQWSTDFRIMRVDGAVRWFNVRGTFLKTSGGHLKAIGVAQDVTERKRAEEELRENQILLTAVMDGTPDPIYVKDRESRILLGNQALAKVAGKALDEIIGKTDSEYYGNVGVGQMLREHDIRVMESGTGYSIEETVPTLDGNRTFLSSKMPFRNAAGQIIGILGISHDITERKRAEEELRVKQAELEQIANATPVILARLDRNLRYVFVNTAFSERFGIKPEVIIGMHLSEIISRKTFESISPHIERVLQGNRVKFDREITFPKIGTKYMQVEYSPEKDSWGNVIGFIATIVDITGRKQTEKELRNAKRQLEHEVRERTAKLVEINLNLMKEIDGRKLTEAKLRSAQKNLRAMVSEVVLAEERSRQHFATDLHDTVVQTLGAAKLRSQLIQDLIPKKAMPLFTELQDMLSEGVKQARSIMAEMSPPVLNELGLVSALEWLAEQTETQHGIEVNFKSQKRDGTITLPREMEILLFQATRELLMNTIKHAQAENASVKFSSNDHKLRIEVSDNGRGFDMKKTLEPDLNGGYGLYSIRERLRHIGGQLAIKSKPGQGTTILILAPREIEKKISE